MIDKKCTDQSHYSVNYISKQTNAITREQWFKIKEDKTPKK